MRRALQQANPLASDTLRLFANEWRNVRELENLLKRAVIWIG
jgi:transcriptional regulator with GAF, ATPase, and Fis domain